jgi:putative transposase
MQQSHLLACIRYIEMNPVRAGLVDAPDKWPWSSTAAHISGHGDGLVKPEPLLAMVKEDWKSFLVKTLETGIAETIRKLGDGAFIEVLEGITGLRLKAGKPGPKPKPMN